MRAEGDHAGLDTTEAARQGQRVGECSDELGHHDNRDRRGRAERVEHVQSVAMSKPE